MGEGGDGMMTIRTGCAGYGVRSAYRLSGGGRHAGQRRYNGGSGGVLGSGFLFWVAGRGKCYRSEGVGAPGTKYLQAGPEYEEGTLVHGLGSVAAGAAAKVLVTQ